jgi:5'-nucleotidase
MRALITNDDGIDSPGIRTLAIAAADAGLDVTVAAPSWDSSGASASLTAVEREGRFLVREAEIEGVGPCFAIEAAPAFIARAAVHEAFGPCPDVLLSGVNLGLNCGHAVLHSGTVGAASTAFTFGVPAFAFSTESDDDPRWDTARVVIAAVMSWFREHTGRVLLNVNVPGCAPEQLRGLRPATLASFGAVTANVTDVGSGYVSMDYREVDEVPEPGTDVDLISQRFATFTSLSPVCETTDQQSAMETSALVDLVSAPV